MLQDWGVLALTLPQGESLRPTKKLGGHALMREQHLVNQALHYRQRRIEPVNRRVPRCRIAKARIRWWKEGVRDLLRALCGALHNLRVRLTPWQPMV